MGERPLGFVPDGFVPDAPTAAPAGGGFVNSATNFLTNFAHNVDPRPALKLLYDAADGFGGMLSGDASRGANIAADLKGLGTAQLEQFKKAKREYDAGRYSEAVGHTIAGALPLVGPAAANAGEQIGTGDVSGGLGSATGVLAGLAAPAVAGKVIPRTARMFEGRPNPNPVAAAAVEYGQQAGIPIDAATATGSPIVAAVQKRVSDSLGGATVAERFKAAQAEKLASVGEQLAAKSNQVQDAGGPIPGVPVTPEQAGSAAQNALRDVVHGKNVEATTAYDRLRRAAEGRVETVQTSGPEAAGPDAAVRFTNKPNALPDEAFEAAYQDAKSNGYAGSRSSLRQRFDDELSSGFRAHEERASAEAEYGPQALLRSIRELGGIRPFDKAASQGIVTKLTGEYENLKQTFAGNRGASAIFKNKGLAIDDMVDQLRQDGRWKNMLSEDPEDLKELLLQIGRDGSKPLPKPTVEDALAVSEVRPGAKWWVPRVEENLALPVDITPAKAALKATRDALARQNAIVPFQDGTGKATALRALERIMQAPDLAPLTEVDAALGDLKSFARADNPDLRTIGQGVIANAVKHLDGLVRGAAAKAGPDVLKALEDGRRATQEKYSAAKVLDGLETGRGEAVQAYKRLVAPGDSAIGQLRDVASQAPEAVPHIARAYLGDLIDTATANGGFEHAAKIDASWRKLGDQTKNVLFEDPQYRSDLDNFFRLGRRIAENPNPSGTARINNLFNAASAVVGYPVAKLLYSKAGVRLLTEGYRVPLQSPTMKAAYMTRLTGALRAAMQADPAMADDTQRQTPPTIGQR